MHTATVRVVSARIRQRLQEHRADVDPRPLRHPQRAVQRPVRPQMRPVLVARGGPRGVGCGAVLRGRVLVAVALPAPPRVIPIPDQSRQPAAGQDAGRGDPGAVEQLDQPADLAGEDRHRPRVPAAETRDRAPRRRAARVDLQREQQLVLLGDVPGPADQPQIRHELIRRVIQRRVLALGAKQIAPERVRVARERPLHPRDPPDRRVIPGQRREHAAVLLKPLPALVRGQQLERAARHPHRSGVRARPPILRDPQQRAVIR